MIFFSAEMMIDLLAEAINPIQRSQLLSMTPAERTENIKRISRQLELIQREKSWAKTLIRNFGHNGTLFHDQYYFRAGSSGTKNEFKNMIETLKFIGYQWAFDLGLALRWEEEISKNPSRLDLIESEAAPVLRTILMEDNIGPKAVMSDQQETLEKVFPTGISRLWAAFDRAISLDLGIFTEIKDLSDIVFGGQARAFFTGIQRGLRESTGEVVAIESIARHITRRRNSALARPFCKSYLENSSAAE